jgi:hypothetical protein
MNQAASSNLLLQHLLSATGQSVAELEGFVGEFGPRAAIWAQTGNEAALKDLASYAAAQAAIRGIQLQGDVEQFFVHSLAVAGRAALNL